MGDPVHPTQTDVHQKIFFAFEKTTDMFIFTSQDGRARSPPKSIVSAILIGKSTIEVDSGIRKASIKRGNFDENLLCPYTYKSNGEMSTKSYAPSPWDK